MIVAFRGQGHEDSEFKASLDCKLRSFLNYLPKHAVVLNSLHIDCNLCFTIPRMLSARLKLANWLMAVGFRVLQIKPSMGSFKADLIQRPPTTLWVSGTNVMSSNSVFCPSRVRCP